MPAISLGAVLVIISVAAGMPQGGLYDDRTGTMFNQAFLAAHMNRDLTGIERIEMLPGNETPVAEERKDHEERPPSHVMGPWMKYRQTYWNPFIYGGPNGPPTFYPSLGVWPTSNQAQ